MIQRAAAIVYFFSAFTCIVTVGNFHFADHADIHNVEHIRQHFKNVMENHNLSEEQQKFYYFSMNDLNKDNLIDGNEILKSITHSHTGLGNPVVDESTLMNRIDDLIREMDLNGDGFIDFPEFMNRHRKSFAQLN
ncbi:Multiple coagulation factor deficiency protein 2 protein [Trichostrongylus colubriformis]|uniref:Multiple coagulation factor deficiency protein 2 protein n=1 Tax=Trichostrongylus colubriformis TaxID=6319 RepID=A0AAN8FCY4_TRICO